MEKSTIIVYEDMQSNTGDLISNNRFYSTKLYHNKDINVIILLVLKTIFKYITRIIHFYDFVDTKLYKIRVLHFDGLEKIPKLLRFVKDLKIDISYSIYQPTKITKVNLEYKEYRIIICEIYADTATVNCIHSFVKTPKKSDKILGLSEEDIRYFLDNEEAIKSYWAAKHPSEFIYYPN